MSKLFEVLTFFSLGNDEKALEQETKTKERVQNEDLAPSLEEIAEATKQAIEENNEIRELAKEW